MRSTVLALVVLAACALHGAGTAHAAASSPAGMPAAGADGLRPCRIAGIESSVRCGVVRRPLDPARPGPEIDVHFAVLPALARNRKADPVFFFAGGPGQSAIDLAPTVQRLLGRLGNRRDIVLIDQRGTGRSAPLACGPESPMRSIADQVDLQRQARSLADCRERLQAMPHGDLRRYTTSIAMQDADAVRQVLGVERVNLVGGSYGTRAALEYARQFPQRVRRAVLDGAAPPDMVLPAAFSADNQSALDAVFASCQAEPACRKRHPELRASWDRLLESLPREVTLPHPVTGREERVTLTREVLLSMVRSPLYAPLLASALPLAIEEASQGRLQPLMGLAVALAGRRSPTALSMGMHLSVVCSEDAPRLDASADAPGRDFGGTFASFYRRLCADWPRGEVPAEFYRVPPLAAPVLLLSGGIDPVTPPRHGARVARALGPSAVHVVVPNAGHGVMALPCLRDVLFRFIDADDDVQASKVDASCALGVPRPPAFAMPGTGVAQ